jgi:hypothetical protein
MSYRLALTGPSALAFPLLLCERVLVAATSASIRPSLISKSRNHAKNTGGNRFAISATYWIDAAEPLRWESAL